MCTVHIRLYKHGSQCTVNIRLHKQQQGSQCTVNIRLYKQGSQCTVNTRLYEQCYLCDYLGVAPAAQITRRTVPDRTLRLWG